MQRRHKKWRNKNSLKIKEFIKNSIFDKETVSFEEIYQICESFVFLNDAKKINKKIIFNVHRYIVRNHKILQSGTNDSIDVIFAVNTALIRLKKSTLALYPLLSNVTYNENNKKVTFIDSYIQDFMKQVLIKELESISRDIYIHAETKSNSNLHDIYSDLNNIFKFYGLKGRFHNIIVAKNVKTDSENLCDVFNGNMLKDIKRLFAFFAEQRKKEYLSPFIYDIEKQTLHLLLQKICFFDTKLYNDPTSFFILFSFYFTADMKSTFFKHICTYLTNKKNGEDKVISLNTFYICIVSAIWIVKSTDYNSEVVTFIYGYLIDIINESMDISIQLIREINECIQNNTDIPKNYFLVHLLDSENHTSMRAYKEEVEYYLHDYENIYENNLHNYGLRTRFKINLDIFYYTLASLKNKTHFIKIYEISMAKRLICNRHLIKTERNIIEGYKNFSINNHFYKCEKMIKDLEMNHCIDNVEICVLNSFLWKLDNIGNFVPNKELIEITNTFLNQKNQEIFTYRFAWNVSCCEVEINGIDIIMTVIQYHILEYVLNECPTDKQIQYRFSTCNFEPHLKALCKCEILQCINNNYFYNHECLLKAQNVTPILVSTFTCTTGEQNKENINQHIKSKILLSIKREKTIKRSRLIELVSKTLALHSNEVENMLSILIDNGLVDMIDENLVLGNKYQG